MGEYWKIIFWLARDIYKLYPRKVILVQLSELGSVVIGYAIGAVAFSVFFVLENGSARFLGQTISFAPTNFNLLVLFSMVGIMLVLQVAARFAAEILINRICRNYEERNVVRAFEKIDRLGVGDIAKLDYPFNRQSSLKSVNIDARSLSIAQRMLLRTPVPLLSAVVAMAILLAINPLAIAGIVLFAILFVPAILFFGQKAVGISKSFEREAGRAALVKLREIDDLSFRPLNPQDKEMSYKRLVAEPEIRSFMEVYEQRFNVMSQSGVVGGAVSAAAVAIVTAVFAWQALKGEMPWSYVILHFVALQFILQAIKRVSTLIVSLNRFYYQLSRFYRLLKIRIKRRSAPDERVEFPVELAFELADGKRQKFNTNKGGRAFLVAGERMNRFAIFGFVNAMGFGENQAIRMLDSPDFVVFSEQNSPATKPANKADIDKIVIEIMASTDDIGASSNKPAMSPVLDNESPAISGYPADQYSYVFDCIAASLANCGIVFIDQKGLHKLTQAQVAKLLSNFQDAFVFIYTFRTIQPTKLWNTDEIICFNGRRITGVFLMEWVLANRDKLVELTKEVAPEGTSAMRSGADFDMTTDAM